MFIIYLIIIIALIALAIYCFIEDEPEIAAIWLLCLIAPVIGVISLTHINAGEEIYTGYIYSTQDVFDKTVAHIRFSKEAGSDAQPSFCVKNGTEKSEKLKELSGSDIKVKVKVPAGFALNMWYGQCPLEAEIIEESK